MTIQANINQANVRRPSVPVDVTEAAIQARIDNLIDPAEVFATFNDDQGEARQVLLTRVQLAERLADKMQPADRIIKDAIDLAEQRGGATAKKTMQTYASSLRNIVGAIRHCEVSCIAGEGFVALAKRSREALKAAGKTWQGYNKDEQAATRADRADTKALREALESDEFKGLPVAERAAAAVAKVESDKVKAAHINTVMTIARLMRGLSDDELKVLATMSQYGSLVEETLSDYENARQNLAGLDDQGKKQAMQKHLDELLAYANPGIEE